MALSLSIVDGGELKKSQSKAERSRSLASGLQSELALLRRHESEKCFGVQIAGGDVAVMSKAARKNSVLHLT